MWTFYIGQKVVCLPDDKSESWSKWWYRIRHLSKAGYPTVGKIYTVVNIYKSWDGDLNLELLELPAPEEKYWLAGFIADGFRPADTRKTDISALTKLLITKRQSERV